jgi:hypothetical protein
MLSLHFETDTGLPVLQEGLDRGAFSLPETSSLRMLLSATDCLRIALFGDLLNCAPISGNVPYLFGWKRQFIGVQGYTFARFWMYGRLPFQKDGGAHPSSKKTQRKGNLMARACAVFWKNPSFSGNSGTRVYA